MPKGKKKKGKARRTARTRVRHFAKKHPTPVFATGGLVLSGVELMTAAPTAKGGLGSPMDSLFPPKGVQRPLSQSVGYAIASLRQNLGDPANYIPAVVGIGVSAIGPKIPIVGKAVSKVIKDVSKGKARL